MRVPFSLVSSSKNFSTILDGFIPRAQGFISFVSYCPCKITTHFTYHSSFVPLNVVLGISENWIAVMIFDFIFLLMKIISFGMLNYVTGFFFL